MHRYKKRALHFCWNPLLAKGFKRVLKDISKFEPTSSWLYALKQKMLAFHLKFMSTSTVNID